MSKPKTNRMLFEPTANGHNCERHDPILPHSKIDLILNPLEKCWSCYALQLSQKNKNLYYKEYYGITLKDVKAMREAQKGRCAICNRTFSSTWMNVDHDHKTGAVRGLLCSNCNRGLGNFKDNIKSLEAAIMYLRRSHEVNNVSPRT